MQQHNRATLEQYRKQYNAWVNDKVLYDLDGAAKQTIQRIIREEWDSNFVTDLWCGHCVAKMLVFAFQRMDESREIPNDVIRIKLNDPAAGE